MTKDIKRGLGDNGTRLLSTLMANGKEIFTVDDAALILDISRNALDNLLYKLAKKKWILRIQKGKYLIIPLEAGYEANYLEHSFLIASSLIEPYYIGYRSALNFYGYTEKARRRVPFDTLRTQDKPFSAGMGSCSPSSFLTP